MARGVEERRLGDVWRAVTPLGRSVLAVGVVAWVLAWRYGWDELAILATACLLSVVIGVVFLLFGNRTLSVLLGLTTPRVVAGEPASTTVEATNEASRRMLPMRLEARVGRGVAHVNVPALAAGASYDELFVIPTKRRSIVPVGPVRSVQGDPLGLVRREVTFTGTEHLYVHPRTVAIESIATGWRRDLEGETTNDRSPSDVAFHTLREYVVGDDRRHIHWRTTARQTDGTLMVREFVDTRLAHVGLLLSIRPGDYRSEDELELAMSTLASLGVRCLADEQDLTCLVGARRVPPYHGTAFLDALAGLEADLDAPSVAVTAARGRDLLASASVVFIVTGSRADAAEASAAAQRIGTTTRSVIVRAELGASSEVRASGATPLLTLGALDDLPRIIRSVSR
ncbi:MAG: DUF58 domain-containing protein [Actinobacteria bacterium]|nr:DUF58 domain-containing protein [Actinomycetota bacterium]